MTITILLVALVIINLILLLVMMFRGDRKAGLQEQFKNVSDAITKAEHAIREEARSNREELAQSLKNFSDSSSRQVMELTKLNELKLENMRQTITEHLNSIQKSNEEKLEQMRATVDEKLHSTLEKRLSESFSQVSERLESVHRGLGEMQKLALEVGNLKNVLSNIKTRGILGEVQLEKILEQILTPDQYERNVNINGNKVEFAIKLPGRDEEVVFLPVDAKFPVKDYEELVEAQEKADSELVQQHSKKLEISIKAQAKEISDKYILPPKTTDFAIMFLPIEGLFAEVLRKPGFFISLREQYKVLVTGPTTFSAILNSLQIGFKTLAIEKRASEVWKLLGEVKTDFGKFADLLEGIRKNLDAASNKIDEAAKKTRVIDRKLKDVQALPSSEPLKISGIEDEETENST